MRILMLSCNTGEGHNATARAVMEVLEARNIGCDLRDVLACLSPRISKFISNWHVRLYKYAPKLFDVGYRAFERSDADPDDTTLVYEILRFSAGKLLELLSEGNYDAVICTHVFSGMMMTEVRRAFRLRIPCYFIATDYTRYPMVEQCDMDGYFIPHPALVEEFAEIGLGSSRLLPMGIPVRQAFYVPSQRQQARQLLDIPEDKFAVLLMCGSMGCGPIRKLACNLLERLPENTMVVAVCGSNKKLYEAMSEIEDPRLRVLGFTRQIPEYMDAVDIIVTKPGGLSTTEAAAKHLPMVLFNTIGGCESRNFDFFLSRGYALGSADPDETVNLAVSLAMQPQLREELHSALQEDFPDNSAQKIADHVIQAAEQYRKLHKRQRSQEEVQEAELEPILLEEGTCELEQQPRETYRNLARSFAGESQSRMRYAIYADVARKENQVRIARVFEEIANIEAVNAEAFLRMMQSVNGCNGEIMLSAGYPYQLGTTEENLQFAAAGEREEHERSYPEFAEVARREGFADAAELWMRTAQRAESHSNTFQTLYEQLASERRKQIEHPAVWRCPHCGYTYACEQPHNYCHVCGKKRN